MGRKKKQTKDSGDDAATASVQGEPSDKDLVRRLAQLEKDSAYHLAALDELDGEIAEIKKMLEEQTEELRICNTIKETVQVNSTAIDELTEYVNRNTQAIAGLGRQVNNPTGYTAKLDCTVKGLTSSRNVIRNSRCRENNIVIHGLNFFWKTKADAEVKVQNIIQNTLNVSAEIVEIIPLGNKCLKDDVPILIKLDSLETKKAIYRNCYKLKGTKFTLVDDLTLEQRKNRSLLMPTLKQLKADGEKVYFRGDLLYVNGKPYLPID